MARTVRVRAEGEGAHTEVANYLQALELIRGLPDIQNGKSFEVINKAGRVSMFRKAGRHLVRLPESP